MGSGSDSRSRSSSSGSDSSSGSSSSRSSSEERRKKKRKREKDAKKKHHHHHHHHKDKKDKKRKDKRRKDKKDKREKKRKSHKRDREREAGQARKTELSWGKFGIIKEGDMYLKQEEFYAWLGEVKGVSQEACGQREIREHFSSFVEDYNTATMPSEKYYDLRAWYAKEQHRMATEGAASSSAAVERTTFDDEAERRAELQRERAKRSHATTMLMAKAMHGGSQLVEDMREQEAKKLKMQDAYKTGDTSTARDLSQKLDPKHVSQEELRKTFGAMPALKSKGANFKS